MSKKFLDLQPSEAVVAQTAGQIYAAYITAGRVEEGQETNWMRRSIREALMIAQATDDAIIAEGEVDSGEDQDISEISVKRHRISRSKFD